ncbi:MAG: phospholipid carrier-dependent glycosyltransferase, partial [Steroidobacteraceae bacterium]
MPDAMAAAARFPWWVWAILAIAWFGTISLRPLLEPDEGRYAEIPREMLAGGDWVTPRLNDLKYFEKPPLQYWATAAVYSVFGVREWTSRVFGFSLAFLCLPMVYAFSRSVFESAAIGVASTLALAVNPAFAVIGRINLLDSAFTFFLSASLFAFLLAMRSEQRSTLERHWTLAMWALLGLAALTKGPAAPVLCGATLVVYTLLTRQWFLWRRLHWIGGLALFAAITVPWFFLVARRNPEFAQYFFVHEHFQRFATDVSRRPGPWWYFLPILVAAVLPWSAVLWRQRGAAVPSLTTRGDAIRVELFLLVWTVVVAVFFSASQSKLLPYVLPAMPAIAVLLAPQIARDARSTAAATWWV